jgi:hypothetical protein
MYYIVNTCLGPAMPEETKTATVQVRLRPSMKRAAERAAKEDSRSLSSLIEMLLAEFLKAKGQ